MRILMVSHAFPPTFGGVESHLWDITTRLSRRGHQLCCLVGGPCDVVDKYLNFEVWRFKNLSVQQLVSGRMGHSHEIVRTKLIAKLREDVSRVIEGFVPQIIHVHNAHHFAPELAYALFTACTKASFVNSVHDRVGEHLYPHVLDLGWKQVLYASNYLAKHMPSKRDSSVLHLGIDLHQFSHQGPLDARFRSFESPVIFHPARLLRWKGVTISLHAFANLRQKLGRGTLVMCESSNIVDDPDTVNQLQKELEEIAADSHCSDHVHYLEFERAEIPNAYRASDIIWYPTIDEEPYGLVPLEAMACGIPLIVSRSGGMIETVIDGETGIIVPKKEAEALAEATLDILSKEAMRQQIVRRGLSHVRQLFDVEHYVDRLENIYARVCWR